MAYADSFRPKGEKNASSFTVPQRTPAKGDRVSTNGHRGSFVVTGVDSEKRMSNLAKIGSPEMKLVVRWQDINFLHAPEEVERAEEKPDENQKALPAKSKATKK